jgi:hypothetical protein
MMIEYLQDFLSKRVGAAPVWATLVGEPVGSRYIMRAVDSAGVVLAHPTTPEHGAAYPWTALLSVTPDLEAR